MHGSEALSEISDLKFEIRDMDSEPEIPKLKSEFSLSMTKRPFGPCCHHSETARLLEAQTAQNVSNRTKRIKVHDLHDLHKMQSGQTADAQWIGGALSRFGGLLLFYCMFF